MSTALILGAASDIARATARRLAADGYDLLLAGRGPDRLQRDADDLRVRFGVDARPVAFDALDFDSHPSFYEHLPARPDLVLCAFGLLGDQAKAEGDAGELRAVLDTNLTGAASILHVVARDMGERGAGTIVGISSVAGDRGRASNYVYGCAKAGLTAFLSGLRNRLAPKGVRVLTVRPGFVRTRMTEGMPLPGPVTAEPEQVAEAIVRAVRRGRNEIYTLWMWRWIMLVIRCIPEAVFKRLKL
jgi:decaprenylphospho-beta-D-erythro-pentofuranosid-2-ulose 2-reductase